MSASARLITALVSSECPAQSEQNIVCIACSGCGLNLFATVLINEKPRTHFCGILIWYEKDGIDSPLPLWPGGGTQKRNNRSWL